MPVEVWCNEDSFTIPSFKLTVWKSCWKCKVLIPMERNIDLWKEDWERVLLIIDNIFSTVLLACNIGALGIFCVDVFCMDVLVHMLAVGGSLGVSFQNVIMQNYFFPVPTWSVYSFQANVAFYIKGSHLTCGANQMNRLHMKYNFRLKRGNQIMQLLCKNIPKFVYAGK